MALSRCKLGDLIERVDIKNEDNLYKEADVAGISTKKEFIETKADLTGVSLSSYKVVPSMHFAYVPDTSRRGNKISLALNFDQRSKIVSSISEVFKVKDVNILLPEYLFMYFNRSEFDRYSRYHSFGSAREPFEWDSMCDIDFQYPDIDTQQKYVDIYKGMVENQKAYEKGLEDLKLVCDATIEKFKKKYSLHPIGEYIEFYDEKNVDGKIKLEQGVNIKKEFISPQRPNSNLTGRKIVRKGMFAYCTQLNNENVAIAYRKGEDCVVSSVYDVFKIKNENQLLSSYLMLWLIRKEFGRFLYWKSTGTSYEFLDFKNICDTVIPIPEIDKQKSVSDIFDCYNKRKEINEKLKVQIKNICPILIKGSIEEASKEA